MPSSSAIAHGVQRPGAAERQQRELARVDAALDGHHPQRPDHLGVGDVEDPLRALAQARGRARSPSAPTAALGRLASSSSAARERRVGVEVAEHEVRVGDRRLLAAVAVARGPGPGARRARADAQRAAGVAQAIDPPPAPTVCRSSIGSATGRSPTRRPARLAHRPPSMTQTSHDVPPMSKHSASGSPAAAPPRPRPRRRRPGPLSTVVAACAPACSTSARPPDGLHDVGPRQARPRARGRRGGAGSRPAAGRARRRSRSWRRARTRGRCPTAAWESETWTPGSARASASPIACSCSGWR